MIIFGFLSFPPESSTEVGKRLLKLPLPPPFVTIKGPFLISEVGSGIKAIVLFEFDQTKTGESMEYVANRYAQYIGVPGLTYNVALWFEAKEALNMIGLA
jgi:hypothetical protein